MELKYRVRSPFSTCKCKVMDGEWIFGIDDVATKSGSFIDTVGSPVSFSFDLEPYARVLTFQDFEIRKVLVSSKRGSYTKPVVNVPTINSAGFRVPVLNT